MKLFKMKITVYHSHKKTNAKGLAPLYVRVQEANVRKEFSTGLFIAKANFNGAEIVGMPNYMYFTI
jgi:hypothetical protein